MFSPVLLHHVNAAALIISVARLERGRTEFFNFNLQFENYVIAFAKYRYDAASCLPSTIWNVWPENQKLKIFYIQIELSDISYPRHVISFLQGSAQLQGLDEERLAKMAEHLNQYNCQLSSMGPGFQTVSGWWLVSFILLIIKILKIVEPV